VHGNSARHGWVWLPNCDAGGLDNAWLSPPASGRGRLLKVVVDRAKYTTYVQQDKFSTTPATSPQQFRNNATNPQQIELTEFELNYFEHI